ncbi:tumor necrosis factor receptor superfamily member 5 isoform X2 [Rhinatrema bivittatum]|uniref:tumor necrosis factor receptor superfamily member 5 isoform X2 n=1 Tax=Rhinatrema bivittatum TaxID=194408 RepID=UPI0011291225|nr:tumor necrosis factor receptor superfamily member 5 isoform X2 [Rhinatrema bivittatum]
MKTKLFWLFLSCSFQFYPVSTLICDEYEFENAGRCCRKCAPGQKMESECTETTNTQCRACGDGEFQSAWNQEKGCHLHSYCDNNAFLFEKIKGTTTTDAVCECVTGRHCSTRECGTCVENTPCGLGHGVMQKATPYSDTMCAPCPPSTFSNISSSTESCNSFTSCEAQGLVVKKDGTAHSDVLCGPTEPRSHEAVIIPIILIVLVMIAVFSAFILYKKGYLKCLKKMQERKVNLHEEEAGQGQAILQIPVETEQEDPEMDAHQAPVQETLSGQQPVLQEEGKDSRMPLQEVE